jgi:predicted aminopeptidase
MVVLRIFLAIAILGLCGCQLDYIAHSAYNQSKILRARKPIEKVLDDPSVPEETKRKLKLVLEVKKFGEEKLGLKPNESYLSFVQLDRDYVSYVLQVAPFNELTHYEWDYPIVGKMPYRGYFVKDLAKDEAKKFPPDKWDTYVRGVSAYSTLGWFHDPVLSSMIRYSDHELVDTILHETVHANIYIKDHADFNERLAMFLGGLGMKQFYAQKEGTDSKTLKDVANEEGDEKKFSEFISRELDELKKWYQEHKTFSEDEKKARLTEIQTRFTEKLKPKLKSDSYTKFVDLKLNNALLLTYQTYLYDLSDFQKLYEKKNHDYRAVLEFCKSLEKSADPEKSLKSAVL